MISQAAVFERFLGRRDELTFLVSSFHAAKANWRGATVVIAGESGVGKTRLVAEFAAVAKRERCALLAGSCLEYASTPYGPFVEALAMDEPAASLERVLRAPTAERAASAETERIRRFQLVEDHLRRRAIERGALILVVEDLHWSDVATLDLLRFLSRRLRDAPIVLIGTYRTDDLASDHVRAAHFSALIREGATELRLARLSDRDIAELLRSALPTHAALLGGELQTVGELSEGKPLIAEELLRAALDRSRLEVEGQPPSAAVSVRATVLARVQSFTEGEQQQLLYAAVIGREFEVELLERLIAVPAASILPTLRRARNLQLIVEDLTRGRFRFRHAITRQILYDELLRSEARLLHERIATVLDELNRGETDEAAYHWWAAAVTERAAAANEAAGGRAEAMYAYADAARSYERALAFATGARRAGLIEKVAFATCVIGDMASASRWCADGAKELERSGQVAQSSRLMLWVARQLYEAGEIERALETVASVRRDLSAQAPSPVHFATEMTFAGMLATLGRAAEALDVLDAAAAMPTEHEPIDDFRSHNARGNALCSLARYQDALAEYRAGLALADRIDNDELRLHALANIGNVSLLLGNMRDAEEAYEAGTRLASERGLQRQGVILASGGAYVALYRGDVASARAGYEGVVGDRSAAPMTVGFAQALGIRLCALVDPRDEGPPLDVEAAVEAAFRLRESQVIAVVAGAAAKLAIASGDRERAETLVRRALAAVTEPDHVYWLCDAAAEVGDEPSAADARRWLERAGAGGTNRAAQAHLSLFMARRCAALGDGATGGVHAAAAAQAFAALPWPFEEATAREAAGDPETARAIYGRYGATRAARRLAEALGYRAGGAPERLTRRERQVVELAGRGYPSREIASELGIGERTVEAHLATAYRKLGVKSRLELAQRLSDAVPP